MSPEWSWEDVQGQRWYQAQYQEKPRGYWHPVSVPTPHRQVAQWQADYVEPVYRVRIVSVRAVTGLTIARAGRFKPHRPTLTVFAERYARDAERDAHGL